jgi:hypothetical protein
MSTATLAPSEEMMSLASGYCVSQAVGVAARLGVADQLSNGPRASDDVAIQRDRGDGGLTSWESD